jgi:hypothetical protein
MVKQVKSRRAPKSRAAADFTTRQLLLAGLGALSLGRKEGVRLFGALVRDGRDLRGRARRAVSGASGRIQRDVTAAGGRVRAAIVPLRGRVEASVTGLQSRLAPLLARLGVNARAQRAPKRNTRARKPAAPRQVRAGRRIKAA